MTRRAHDPPETTTGGVYWWWAGSAVCIAAACTGAEWWGGDVTGALVVGVAPFVGAGAIVVGGRVGSVSGATEPDGGAAFVGVLVPGCRNVTTRWCVLPP